MLMSYVKNAALTTETNNFTKISVYQYLFILLSQLLRLLRRRGIECII